jgi:hypothetical protein
MNAQRGRYFGVFSLQSRDHLFQDGWIIGEVFGML